MKISRITAYKVDLPMREGSYSWAKQSFAAFDSTVVIVETDDGVTGAGECCPLGPSYLPAYAEGVRAGIAKLAPELIGLDPTETDRLDHRMDLLLKGHPYVKSGIDMACWDLLGKSLGKPVYALLGGRFQDRVKLFRVLSRGDPDKMAERLVEYRAEGYRQFQLKVGENPTTDIERFRKAAAVMEPGDVLDADANTGWRQHDAMRVVAAAEAIAREHNVPIYIEQPCLSYEECLAVRQHTNLPFILDECMDGLPVLLRGYQDRAMDLINLKINRVGGLTRARQFRDLCVSLGIVMTIEDSWGGEIATAAIAHLAHSTPEDYHFQSSPFHDYTDTVLAEGGPKVENGYMAASAAPGLGVEPRMDVLGDPVIDVH